MDNVLKMIWTYLEAVLGWSAWKFV